MKILFLDGHPKKNARHYKDYLKELIKNLTDRGHVVDSLVIRDLDIRFCTGCWSCWVKTPGQCITKDDSHEVCRRAINSDLVLFATPLVVGCQSALMKKTQDKLIPLVHPYIELVQGECHHIKRYDSYPLMGLLVEKAEGSDQEDVEITSDLFRRFALNIKNEKAWIWTMAKPVEEVADEINHL
jgi:multimeric flavodoxin WrbA